MSMFRRAKSTLSSERMDYELARLPRQLATAITWYMEQRGIRQVDLAERLGVTPGRISQILSGDENLTLRTLAAVCVALDARLVAQLVEDDTKSPSLAPAGR